MGAKGLCERGSWAQRFHPPLTLKGDERKDVVRFRSFDYDVYAAGGVRQTDGRDYISPAPAPPPPPRDTTSNLFLAICHKFHPRCRRSCFPAAPSLPSLWSRRRRSCHLLIITLVAAGLATIVALVAALAAASLAALVALAGAGIAAAVAAEHLFGSNCKRTCRLASVVSTRRGMLIGKELTSMLTSSGLPYTVRSVLSW